MQQSEAAVSSGDNATVNPATDGISAAAAVVDDDDAAVAEATFDDIIESSSQRLQLLYLNQIR